MPKLLKHIDAIARQKQRDVLFLRFCGNGPGDYPEDYDEWKRLPARKHITEWLDQNQITWFSCADYALENFMGPYLGQIYLDVPFDETDPSYQRLRDYLENPDGTTRHTGAWFILLPLERAMENAHHDEPGFWERWAEDI